MFNIQKKPSYLEKNEKLIFSFAEIDLDIIPLVGEKILSVAQLSKTDIPVPPGYAISTRLFEAFMHETGIIDEVKKEMDLVKVKKMDPAQIRRFSKKIQDKILRTKFPDFLAQDIIKAYSRLSGFSDSWVAVRSSIMTDMAKHADFIGQLYTELNVRGRDEVLDAVKKCFASIFALNSVEYALAHDLNPANLQVGVLVQKMVQAEVSGVMFTVDPVTNNCRLLTIEAVYGLGDTISAGELSPDQYIVEKEKFHICDRRVAPQEWMHVLKMRSRGFDSEKVRISPAWQSRQKLEDNKILELAEIGVAIENFMKRPQDIEWVMENGQFLVVQTRSVIKLDPEVIHAMGDRNIREERRMIEDIERLARDTSQKIPEDPEAQKSKPGPEFPLPDSFEIDNLTMGIDKRLHKKALGPTGKSGNLTKELPKGMSHKTRTDFDSELKQLIKGTPASNGTVSGRANIVLYKEDQADIKKGDILVITGEDTKWIAGVKDIAGIITNTGGATSDIALTARHMGVPCIVDTQIGTKIIRQQEIITIDGSTGSIYEGALDTKSVVRQKERKIKKSTKKKTKRKKVKTVIIDDKEIEVQDVKILTATKTMLDFSTKDSLTDYENQPFDVSDGVGVLSANAILKLIGIHPAAFINDKKEKDFCEKLMDIIRPIAERSNPYPVIYNLSDMSTKGFILLKHGKENEKNISLPYPSIRGIERHLFDARLMRLELDAVKKLRNKEGLRNISVAISYVRSAAQLAEIKKEISALGLRRSKSFNLYLNPTIAANILEIDKLLEGGIDGVLIDPARFAGAILGYEYEEESSINNFAKNMANNTVVEALEGLLKKVHKEKLMSMVRIPVKDNDFLKNIIELGANAVILPGEKMSKMQRKIRDLENSLVMKKVRK